MVNYDYVLTLYVASLFSAGPTVNLLYKNWKRRGVTLFFVLPLIALASIIAFMVIDLNLAFSHPEFPAHSDTSKILVTVQALLDAISGVALGWAYVLRLRVVVNTSVYLGELPYWVGLAVWVTAIMPTIYPASDIVSIVAQWTDLASTCCGGHLTTYLYGSFNVAFALHDLIMEFSLAHILFSRTLIDPRRRKRLLIVALSLSIVSAGLMAGAIVTFFNNTLGVQIIYAFWLVNVWVFMETNRILGKTLEGKKSTTSGSRGSDRKTTTSSSGSHRTPAPGSRELV